MARNTLSNPVVKGPFKKKPDGTDYPAGCWWIMNDDGTHAQTREGPRWAASEEKAKQICERIKYLAHMAETSLRAGKAKHEGKKPVKAADYRHNVALGVKDGYIVINRTGVFFINHTLRSTSGDDNAPGGFRDTATTGIMIDGPDDPDFLLLEEAKKIICKRYDEGMLEKMSGHDVIMQTWKALGTFKQKVSAHNFANYKPNPGRRRYRRQIED